MIYVGELAKTLLNEFDEGDDKNWWFLSVSDLNRKQKINLAVEELNRVKTAIIGAISYLGRGAGTDYMAASLVEHPLLDYDLKSLAETIVDFHGRRMLQRR